MIRLLTELSEFLERQIDETCHGWPNKARLLKRDVDAEIERLKGAAPQVPIDREAGESSPATEGERSPAVAAPTHDCTANMQARCAICGALPNSSPWPLVPSMPTDAMKQAGMQVRVNLQFRDHGISGFLSAYEVGEIYERMVEAGTTATNCASEEK